MRDEDKTREQLIAELIQLRQQIAESEASGADRKQDREAELKEAQKYAQDIIESSIDIIVAVDKDRRIIEFNKAAVETFGYSRDEILGRHVEILYSDPKGEGVAVHEAAMETGQFTGEVTNKRRNGEAFPSFLSASVLRDTKGGFIGVMGISRDITDLKQAEEKLQESRQRLELALRGAALGLWDWNIQTGEVVFSERCAEMLGYSPDEIEPHISMWGKLAHPDDISRIEDALNAHLEGRTPFYETEHRLRAKAGGWKWVLDRGQVVKWDTDGNPLRAAGTRLDITERKRTEEERARVSKLESIGVLAGSIAYDFNNILTAILGNVSLASTYLKTGEAADEVLEKLKEAEQASVQAKDLTRQLLTFSSVGSPIKELASIAEILRESAIFALRGSNVRCEFFIPDDLWPVKIDEGKISQVINNLVINADQAMPEGGVIEARVQNVTLGTEDAIPLKDGEYVRMSIEDHGIGIPEEHIQRIFDPFFTTKRKDRGLGLATSYSIIKDHGGYITVESRLGVGSTFYAYLPAFPEAMPRKREGAEDEPIRGKGRILVMDGEQGIRDLACEMLNSVGYDVTTTADGSEAIELYKKAKESGQPYDAVIMEIVVPGGMGGRETVQWLREIDPEVKAIVSSGYTNDPIMADPEKYGFKGVIAKPYKVAELSAVLHRVITGE